MHACTPNPFGSGFHGAGAQEFLEAPAIDDPAGAEWFAEAIPERYLAASPDRPDPGGPERDIRSCCKAGQEPNPIKNRVTFWRKSLAGFPAGPLGGFEYNGAQAQCTGNRSGDGPRRSSSDDDDIVASGRQISPGP
jgi:hypothetical protein